MSEKSLPKTASDAASSEIFELLKYNNGAMSVDALLENDSITCKSKNRIRKLLFKLSRVHKVVRLDSGQWTAAVNIRTVVGYYSVLRSGVGLVKPIEDKSKSVTENNQNIAEGIDSKVYIRSDQVADAWPGDLVRVAISSNHQKSNKRTQGYIVEVIEKKQSTCTVEVEFYSHNYFLCKSTDSRIDVQFQVDATTLSTPPQAKELLEVKLVECLAINLWSAQAITNLGREDNIHSQENLVKLNHHVPSDFPDAVLKEISKFSQDPSEKDISKRTDLRHIPFVTIDGESAKDFDDAIHVEKINNNYILRVAIADVTHYVHNNTALDNEAKARGNSWYFPRSVEPMLPHALSSGLCSLKPDKNRLTMVVEIVFSQAGNIVNYNFFSAVICSAARLTYIEVEQIFKQDAPRDLSWEKLAKGSEIIAMLETAFQLAKSLIAIRSKRGSLDFELPEPEYYFSEDNIIIDIKQKEKLFSHKLIEEFMVATNEVVASALTKNKIPFLYRVHPEPAESKLSDFLQTMHSTGLLIEQNGNKPSISQILKSVQNTSKEFLISRLALRTMAQARYQPENEGHFGLASESYCHFTSPIRRYADIVVHRALKYSLGFNTDPIPTDKNLLLLGDSLNHLERASMDAEREISRRLGVLFLKNHVGKSFDGIIATLTDFGIFVELDQIPVSGMIHLGELNDDYYEYKPERQELIGIRKGIRYALGQKVHIFVKDVNLNRLEINFMFNNDTNRKDARAKYFKSYDKRENKVARSPNKKLKDRGNSKGKKPSQVQKKKKI